MAKRERVDVRSEADKAAAYARRRARILAGELTTEQRQARAAECSAVLLRVYAGRHPAAAHVRSSECAPPPSCACENNCHSGVMPI